MNWREPSPPRSSGSSERAWFVRSCLLLAAHVQTQKARGCVLVADHVRGLFARGPVVFSPSVPGVLGYCERAC